MLTNRKPKTGGDSQVDNTYARLPGEAFEDYFVRICQNKNVYGLTFEQVADILNAECGETYTESKWRKQWKNFNRGMQYARKHYSNEVLDDQCRQLEKQRYRLAEERSALKRMVRDEARKDAWIDEIKLCFSRQAPLPFPMTRKLTANNGGTLVVVASDWHIGMAFNTPYGEYNSDIAAKYVDEYANQAISAANTLGADKCVVAFAGDMISGVIHSQLRVESREALVEQIKLAEDLSAKFIHKLSGVFTSVDVYGVGGNHSRVFDKDNAMLGEMLDDLIPHYIRAKLANCQNVFVHEPEYDMALESFYVGNKHTILVHGEYDNVNEANLGRLERMTGGIVDVVICGHLHENMFADVSGVHVIRGGTLGGSGDQYTLKGRYSCEPSQTMAYFDAENKLRAILPVYFKN